MSNTRYEDIVYNHDLTPVSAAVVTVVLEDTTTPASLFDEAGSPISNPVVTDGNGYFFFYVAPGSYTLTVSGGVPPISPTSHLNFTIAGGGGVTSVFGRTGDVVGEGSDYSGVDNLTMQDSLGEGLLVDTLSGHAQVTAQNSLRMDAGPSVVLDGGGINSSVIIDSAGLATMEMSADANDVFFQARDLSVKTIPVASVANSPTLSLKGVYEVASTPTYASDTWSFQDVVGAGVNGTSTLALAHSGSSGTAKFDLSATQVTLPSGQALASPALTGVPTVPTAAALTNNTQAASTGYADAAVAVETTRATTAEGLLVTSSALATETTNRTTADTTLQTNITAEASTRATADTTEATARATADGLLVPKTTTVAGHALSANVVVSASDLTTGTLPHAQLPALVSGDIPNNGANTSGTAGGLSANITESQVTSLTTDLGLKAPLASPALTGTPTVPTATALTNTTQAASTAYADAAVAVEVTARSTADTAEATTRANADALLAPLASPTFTGTVTAAAISEINATAATNLGVNQSSPLLTLAGTYFSGSGASATDAWSLQDVPAAGRRVDITGTGGANFTESAGSVVTVAMTSSTLLANDICVITGLSVFAWLNGQTVTLLTGTAGACTFNDPTAHGAQTILGSTTGAITQINPVAQLAIAHAGSAATQVVIPNAPQPSVTVNALAPITGATQNAGWGFGPLTGLNGSLGTFVPSTGAVSHIQGFQGNTSMFTVQTANNSPGNQLLYFNAVAAQTGFRFLHSYTTTNKATGNPGFSFGGNSGNVGHMSAVSGDQVVMAIGCTASGIGPTPTTFLPVYGTATIESLLINPTINQAAITGTIAGVQVVSNVVTLVFSNTLSATPMNAAATTVNAAAVTNTAVNLNPATLASAVARVVSGTVTNSVENSSSVVTLSLTHSIAANDYCFISGLTVATWLNNKVVKITSVVANTSITFTDPTTHGTKATGAEAGGTVVTSYVTYAKTTANITLTTDTGTAVQQATGAYTNILIQNVETAVAPSPATIHKFVSFQAGAAGTTEKFSVDNTGAIVAKGLQVFANNAAAVAGGLVVGAFYRTGADPDPVCVVH